MAGNGDLFVYETILNQIESHLLTPGMQLPSEVDLARELSVSRMTVRKALTRLEEENRIFRRVGVGTFVKAATAVFVPANQYWNRSPADGTATDDADHCRDAAGLFGIQL